MGIKKRYIQRGLLLAPLVIYLVTYTALVTPSRFVQCLGIPFDYLNRYYGKEPATPLPEYIPGNGVRLLANGNEALPAMLQAIQSAQHTIRWQVMLFAPDEAGLQLADALVEAAQRGVQVQLAFDIKQSVNGSPVTSHGNEKRKRFEETMPRMLERLQQAGVVIMDSRPGIEFQLDNVSENAAAIQRTIVNTSCISANHYDHRKMLIVDDHLAILGGMNVGNEYLYHVPFDPAQDMLAELRHRRDQHLPEAWEKWQDANVLIEGAGVSRLIEQFNWRWEVMGGKAIAAGKATMEGNTAIRVLSQRPGYSESGNAYLALIENAQREIMIINPYVTYEPLLDALVAARKRGVRVVFIFPDRYNDVALARELFRHLAGRLIDGGVELYFYDQRMSHAKVMVVDGQYTTIGSFNLNHRSFKHDLEIAVEVDDPQFAVDVIAQLMTPSIQYGTRITQQPEDSWTILHWIAHPFA